MYRILFSFSNRVGATKIRKARSWCMDSEYNESFQYGKKTHQKLPGASKGNKKNLKCNPNYGFTSLLITVLYRTSIQSYCIVVENVYYNVGQIIARAHGGKVQDGVCCRCHTLTYYQVYCTIVICVTISILLLHFLFFLILYSILYLLLFYFIFF